MSSSFKFYKHQFISMASNKAIIRTLRAYYERQSRTQNLVYLNSDTVIGGDIFKRMNELVFFLLC